MNLNHFCRIVGKNYRSIALIVLNTIVAFLVLNLMASGILDFREYLRKRAESGKGPYSYKKYETRLQEVYPNLSEKEINELLVETKSLALTYDPYTQFKDRPIKGKFVNADIRGFRPIKDQDPYPPPPNPGVRNIFLFGGSTTFGYGVSDDETIASHLQDILKQGSSENIKVYNFGRCSYISVQERLLLEKLILDNVVPDIAVFIDGLNDLVQSDGNPSLTKDLTKFVDQGERLALENYLLRLPLFKLIFNPTQNVTESNTTDANKVVSNVIARYKVNKEIVESIAIRFKIRTLFVWQPVPVYGYDQDRNIFRTFDYDSYLPYVRPGYEYMKREVTNNKVGENFLWLANVQDGLKEPLYVDAVHYSGSMSKIIAKAIADKLLTQHIVSKQRL